MTLVKVHYEHSMNEVEQLPESLNQKSSGVKITYNIIYYLNKLYVREKFSML